jgi:hypothetical protein
MINSCSADRRRDHRLYPFVDEGVARRIILRVAFLQLRTDKCRM